MATITPFSTTTLQQLERGELFAFTAEHGEEFGIKLQDMTDGRSVVAMLPLGSAPHMSAIIDHADCLSFGTSWLFEIEPINRFPFNPDDDQTPGVACVRGNNVLLRFGRDPQNVENRGGWLDLNSFSFAPQSTEFAYFTRRWRIWLSASDRERVGASPLLTSADLNL